MDYEFERPKLSKLFGFQVRTKTKVINCHGGVLQAAEVFKTLIDHPETKFPIELNMLELLDEPPEDGPTQVMIWTLARYPNGNQDHFLTN